MSIQNKEKITIKYHPEVDNATESLVTKEILDKGYKNIQNTMQPISKLSEAFEKDSQRWSNYLQNYEKSLKYLQNTMRPVSKLSEAMEKAQKASNYLQNYEKSLKYLQNTMQPVSKLSEALEKAQKASNYLQNYEKSLKYLQNTMQPVSKLSEALEKAQKASNYLQNYEKSLKYLQNTMQPISKLSEAFEKDSQRRSNYLQNYEKSLKYLQNTMQPVSKLSEALEKAQKASKLSEALEKAQKTSNYLQNYEIALKRLYNTTKSVSKFSETLRDKLKTKGLMNKMKQGNYNSQVFINCPFDDEYAEMFRAIVFTVFDCGLIPRCSLEIMDATELRLQTIKKLVEYCKYGIHDLSYVKLDKKTKLPRFNMPFESGIFYGAKYFGQGHHNLKNCIIFEKTQYSHRKYISDLSGIDIDHHNKSCKEVICSIRKWLASSLKRKIIPSANDIYKRYNEFDSYFVTKICKPQKININSITSLAYVEFTKNITDWLRINKHSPNLYKIMYPVTRR